MKRGCSLLTVSYMKFRGNDFIIIVAFVVPFFFFGVSLFSFHRCRVKVLKNLCDGKFFSLFLVEGVQVDGFFSCPCHGFLTNLGKR